MSREVTYIAVLFAILVVPKALQRFRLPAAISALLIGIGAKAAGVIEIDATLSTLATFGIVALFLFAGLEVSFDELRRHARVLAQHLALRLVVMLGATAIIVPILGLDPRAAALMSFALFTPSTGFILDSLGSFGLSEEERTWVKSKAIATELLALGGMFFILQSATLETLAISTGALIGLVVAAPIALRIIGAVVVPFAPKSEFALLVMLAVGCAFATKALGVYYLVGAFLVGIVAQHVRERVPAMSSERMLHSVEALASLMVPFYFFKAGVSIDARNVTVNALVVGAVLVAVCVPIKLGIVMLHRWLALREPVRESARISLSMQPTLVFTLVIAEILRSQFALPMSIFYGLIFFTIINTMLPGFVLRRVPANFDEVPRSPDVQDGSPPSKAQTHVG